MNAIEFNKFQRSNLSQCTAVNYIYFIYLIIVMQHYKYIYIYMYIYINI